MQSGVPTETMVRTLERAFQRVLGRYGGEREGPLVVVVGGLHGNEPAGVLAARRVMAELERSRPAMRGRLIALAGNLEALERGQRFMARDLNRLWSRRDRERIAAQDPARDLPEEAELRGLLAVFGEVDPRPGERVLVLDLHSTSASGPPFVCLADTLQNREIALAMCAPVILGLEEVIEGSLLEFASERGHAAVACEGGQHQDPDTVRRHEAAIWLALVATGNLEPADVPDFEQLRERMRSSWNGAPAVVDIQHRHGIDELNGFVMQPGYTNFQPVGAGELLARDHAGDVHAPIGGRILLPRYQGQGDDGFFIARQVRMLWLRLSAALRRLRAERLLRLLPGVQRSHHSSDVLIVDQHVARFLAVDLFHLFGFRRSYHIGERVTFERRRDGRPWR